MDSTAEIPIQGSRILIVDDDEMIRKLLRQILEQNGFSVFESDSGEAALDSVRTQAPDLILLDVIMEGIDGFTACRSIKEMPNMEEVPIIFVTGRSDTNSVVKGLDAGGSDYITKPINRHEALARIRNHLKMRTLMRLQREFIEGLKNANLAKNRIIGVASHDLRNPLVSIRGLSEFLAEIGPLSEEQAEIARTIQSTSDSMLQMVDELLDLSVIESGVERCELKPCCVRDVITSSIQIYQFAGSKKAIKLEFHDLGMPSQLMLDRMQFRRMIDNFLSNAVKYSPSGSTIRVVASTERDAFKVAVEDEGPGIPEDEMKILFTDFGKTSVRPTANESSTGLGLSICKKIAQLHKGTVFAENLEGGRGARFGFVLSLNKLKVA